MSDDVQQYYEKEVEVTVLRRPKKCRKTTSRIYKMERIFQRRR